MDSLEHSGNEDGAVEKNYIEMPKIKYLKNTEIDETLWDACVNRDAFPLIYGNIWYLDLVCHEWDALVYGDYEAVLPLPFKKKAGFYYLYRPYGVQQLGVFGDVSKTEELLNAIPKKYIWVDIFLNANNPINEKAKGSYQTNLILDLNKSYEKIYNSYNKQTQRNIKKAQKTAFSSFGYENPEMLINLFKRNKGKQLSGLNEKHYAKMLQIMHVLLHKNLGYMHGLYVEPNHLCAAIFFMEWKGRVTFLFSATDDIGKQNQAMTKILNEFFIAQSGKPILFDFEGSNIPNLARFYKGFGAEEEKYFNFQRSYLPLPVGLIRKFI